MKQLLERASEEACAEANRRYQIIAPYLSGDKPSLNREVSKRTIQRWLNQWNQAEHLYGSGYVGLLPHVNRKGNRKQKLPFLTHKLMAEFIEYDYETYKQKSKRAVYEALVNACERENTTVPSYKTFLKYCNNRPTYEQTQKRQGSRSAYSNEPFYWEARIHHSKTWRASLGYLPFRPYFPNASSGAIVTIDAMGTQTEIVRLIHAKKAD